MSERYVINRKGEREPIDINKITLRLEAIRDGRIKDVIVDRLDMIDTGLIVESLMHKLSTISGETTKAIDEFSARVAYDLAHHHPNYDLMAGRIIMANVHKEADPTFLEFVQHMASGVLDPLDDPSQVFFFSF